MISLKKGQEVDLSKSDIGLRRVVVGLGWKADATSEGEQVDLDASAFLLNRDGRVRNDTDFVFYNNLDAENGAVKHMGDSLTGQGDGDDEQIQINLQDLPFEVEKIAFAVTIHNAEDLQQNFGLVKSAFIRIFNQENGIELARFDLAEDASDETAFVFGEIFRDGEGWKFKAIGAGTPGGLYKIASDYRVNVAAP